MGCGASKPDAEMAAANSPKKSPARTGASQDAMGQEGVAELKLNLMGAIQMQIPVGGDQFGGGQFKAVAP